VFVGVTYFVERPKKIIPSWVRLEPAKERLDLLRYILGPPESICHFVNAPGERESGVFRIDDAGRDRHLVPSVVESTAKVYHDIASNIGDGHWKGLSQLDLVNLMVQMLWVRLNHSHVWVGLLELVDFPLKIGKVFFSVKGNVRALERDFP
jgi:hypothetical protein